MIALTGLSHPTAPEEAGYAGFDGFLLKPYDVDALVALLK